MSRLLRYLAAIVLAAVLTACQVDTTVEVDIADDGSGTVTASVGLDEAAVARAGDLDRLVVVDDLSAAGWTLTPTTLEADGLTWIRATKDFRTADEVSGILAEISPAIDVAVKRSHSFGETSFSVTGTIDLAAGLDALGDDDLERLLGSAAGVDVAALEAEVGPLVDATDFDLTVNLPYDAGGNGEVDGDRVQWRLELGDEMTAIDAGASQRHSWTLLWLLVAAAMLLALVVVLGRRAWRYYTGADLVPNTYRPMRQQTTIAETMPAPDDTDEPAPRRLELVVLDGFGVLFAAADDITTVLGPFVAENGGTDDPVEVAERYRQASLGRLSSAEFWQALGVKGDTDSLDHEFVARIQLSEGALTFLERAKLQGLGVACLANGLARWFTLLRKRERLDVYCETWLISSELGVRKPDPAAYEALRRATGVPLGNCLMIDDRVEHLDAARRAGLSTALFGSRPGDPSKHPRLSRFESLLK